MSHCKACDAAISKSSEWKVFDENYEGVVPDEEENLCSTCLGKASSAYRNLIHMSPQDIELECKEMFYKEFAFIDDLEYHLQCDPEYNTLQIQGM